MIVVAIIAILASIAYPSYAEYVRQGRRIDAQASMVELAQFMERYYASNNSYADAELPSSIVDRVGNYYTITLSDQDSQSYTLSAEPKGAQSGDKCGTMTMQHTGAQSADIQGCWN